MQKNATSDACKTAVLMRLQQLDVAYLTSAPFCCSIIYTIGKESKPRNTRKGQTDCKHNEKCRNADLVASERYEKYAVARALSKRLTIVRTRRNATIGMTRTCKEADCKKKYLWKSIEVVVTARTRNAVATYRWHMGSNPISSAKRYPTEHPKSVKSGAVFVKYKLLSYIP